MSMMKSARYGDTPYRAIEIVREMRPIRSRKAMTHGVCLLLTLILYIPIVCLTALASPWLLIITLPVWAFATLMIYRYAYTRFGWLNEANLIFVTTAAVTENDIPRNAFEISRDFLVGSLSFPRYERYKKIFTRALWELNLAQLRHESLIGDVLGTKTIMRMGRQFLRFFLVYMRAGCIAYVLYRGIDRDEDEADTVSAACAYYCVNWKQLSARGADITILVCGFLLVVTSLLSVLFVFLIGLTPAAAFRASGVPFAFLLTVMLKDVFLDTAITVHYVKRYFDLTRNVIPDDSCYYQMRRVSPTVNRIMKMGGNLTPAAYRPSYSNRRRSRRPAPLRASDATHPLVCPRCRTGNVADALFCAGCGFRLR